MPFIPCRWALQQSQWHSQQGVCLPSWHFLQIFERKEPYNTVMGSCHRIQRDIVDRGRDVAGVIQQYTKFVKPAFDTYVAPSRKHADVIVPWARRAAPCG
jgi:Phosphoribulokinase / Uridine kinase family